MPPDHTRKTSKACMCEIISTTYLHRLTVHGLKVVRVLTHLATYVYACCLLLNFHFKWILFVVCKQIKSETSAITAVPRSEPPFQNPRSTTELQGLLPHGETCTKINGYMDLLIAYPPTLVQSSLKLYAHIQTAIFSIFMTLPTPNPLPM